jgi:hypothetical protein
MDVFFLRKVPAAAEADARPVTGCALAAMGAANTVTARSVSRSCICFLLVLPGASGAFGCSFHAFFRSINCQP